MPVTPTLRLHTAHGPRAQRDRQERGRGCREPRNAGARKYGMMSYLHGGRHGFVVPIPGALGLPGIPGSAGNSASPRPPGARACIRPPAQECWNGTRAAQPLCRRRRHRPGGWRACPGVCVGRSRQPVALRSSFDLSAHASHLASMRSYRRFRSATAAFQAVVLLVVATGVPSHHHERPGRSRTEVGIDRSHHSHATVLVDQDDRVTSGGPEVGMPVSVRVEPTGPGSVPVIAPRETTIRPRERAPPPGRFPRPPPARS